MEISLFFILTIFPGKFTQMGKVAVILKASAQSENGIVIHEREAGAGSRG